MFLGVSNGDILSEFMFVSEVGKKVVEIVSLGIIASSSQSIWISSKISCFSVC